MLKKSTLSQIEEAVGIMLATRDDVTLEIGQSVIFLPGQQHGWAGKQFGDVRHVDGQQIEIMFDSGVYMQTVAQYAQPIAENATDPLYKGGECIFPLKECSNLTDSPVKTKQLEMF